VTDPRRCLGGLAALAVLALSRATLAAPVADLAPASPVDDLLARPGMLLLTLAAFAVLPFAFMALTAFAKISTVLHIVRGAIGATSVPSNAVVLALSVALTLIAMAPVGARITDQLEPILAAPGRPSSELVPAATTAVVEPLRGFLAANASDRERARFFELARAARPAAERDRVGRDDLVVLVPAFMTTELAEAFALGFAIYLPLLVIDLVVANVLLALGMQMMSPTQVSLPFKLLLFVAIDGWGLLAQALITSYSIG
jgi:type III secretion protein R